MLGLGIGLWSNVAAIGGGGGAPWTPASLPGLKVWAEADPTKLFTDAGTTNVTTDGQAVYQMNDKSGNANNFTQVTAGFRPLYRTGAGKPYLEFNGTSQNITMPSFVPLVDGTGQHYIGISVYFNANIAQYPIQLYISGGQPISQVANDAGPAFAVSFNNVNSGTNETGPAITAATGTVLIYTVTPSAHEVFVDNVTDGSTALTGTRLTGNAEIILGSTVTPNLYTAGRIYGVVQGSGVLSSGDRASLQAYLAALHP